ncbi:MAG: Slp family lipoprotein, partial [Nitrospira sp.]|nr:Slp family lipoprotein [Nitrospira sp.]
TTDDRADRFPSGTPQISYAQVKATPESYSGQSVTFGGKVLGARRLLKRSSLKSDSTRSSHPPCPPP